MSNEVQNIEKHLSNSAKEELERILNDEKVSILTKAEQIAKTRTGREDEILLKDIIEAKDNPTLNSIYVEREKKRDPAFYRKIFFYSGTLYTLFGILIYLFQNKTFSIIENTGLFIALTGIIASTVSFLLIEKTNRREKNKILKIISANNDNALTIVGRWMIIEKILSEMISTQTGERITSFNQINSYISSNNFNQELSTTIKNLLRTRNAVVHNKMEVTDSLVKGYSYLAGNVIEQLKNYSVYK